MSSENGGVSAIDMDAPAAAAKFEQIEIPVASIEANPWNPNEMDLPVHADLQASIKDIGVPHDPSVVPIPGKPGKYRLIDGEQRITALRKIGVQSVQCNVYPADTPVAKQMAMTVRLNNIHGRPNERRLAMLLRDLHDTHKWDIAKIEAETGYREAAIRMRLDRLSSESRETIKVPDLSSEPTPRLEPPPSLPPSDTLLLTVELPTELHAEVVARMKQAIRQGKLAQRFPKRPERQRGEALLSMLGMSGEADDKEGE